MSKMKNGEGAEPSRLVPNFAKKVGEVALN